MWRPELMLRFSEITLTKGWLVTFWSLALRRVVERESKQAVVFGWFPHHQLAGVKTSAVGLACSGCVFGSCYCWLSLDWSAITRGNTYTFLAPTTVLAIKMWIFFICLTSQRSMAQGLFRWVWTLGHRPDNAWQLQKCLEAPSTYP